MLYLLQRDVSRERRDDGIDVCDTFFVKRLIDLQKDTSGPKRYATAANYAWLREKGQELATGVLEMLVTIANIGDDHWIALILDFKASRILVDSSSHRKTFYDTLPSNNTPAGWPFLWDLGLDCTCSLSLPGKIFSGGFSICRR